MTSCPACGAVEAQALPIPHPTQSVLSDGHIFARPLVKVRCMICGLIRHREIPDADTVRAFYDDSYDLAAETAPSDIPRSNGYADVLTQLFDDAPPRRVLELGCGAGHILHVLANAWEDTDFTGCEAAPAVARAAQRLHDRIAVHQGFAEDLERPATGAGFDLVFSVNVFEHAADPVQFLQAKAHQLAPGGAVVVICPATGSPNVELVFQDHIHSFTPQAVRLLAERAGLHLVRHDPHPQGLGDFQMFVFNADAPEGMQEDPAPPDPVTITAYLEGWRGLDAELLARAIPRSSSPKGDSANQEPRSSSPQGDGAGQRLLIFGAGEMAALLRAYAPRTWAAAEALVVDDVSGARALGLPVRTLADASPGTGDILILATHPRSQTSVAQRLAETGARCVTFADLIPG